MNTKDAAEICAIYNYYIENTTITFEEAPLQTADMEGRMREINLKYPYLVLEDEAGVVNGYAYVTTWKERSAYKYAAELSIYLRNGFQGRGMGTALMEKLLEEVRKTKIHSLIAGITIPNEKSITLHEKFGFKRVAYFTEIGYKFDQWLDVGYWELMV